MWGTNELQQFDEGPKQEIGFMIHELQNGDCQTWLLFIPARFGLQAKPSPQSQIVEKSNGGGRDMQTNANKGQF